MSTRGVVSEWYGVQMNDKFLDCVVSPGDLIEIDRRYDGADEASSANHHWAVYVGHHDVSGWTRACVVHCRGKTCCNDSIPGSSLSDAFFGTCSGSSSKYGDECQLAQDRFDDVVGAGGGDSRYRIANGLDKDWEPHSRDDVVERAMVKLAEWRSTQMDDADDDWVVPSAFSGCRHFALWCRYDENLFNSLTETATDKADAIKAGLAVGAAGAAIAGLGYLLLKSGGSKQSDKKKDGGGKSS